MRKIYLGFIASIFATVAVAQPTLEFNVPSVANATTQVRAPNGTSSHTTVRAHLIIPASEITTITNGTAIISLGFNYAADVNLGATGNIQFYMENTTDATNVKSGTWATAITGMTSVYSGAYSIPAGTVATSVSVPISSFTYTGGGLYIAYDYVGSTFSAAPATYQANNTLAGGLKSAADPTAVAPLTVSPSAFRPQMRLGIANPYTNELSVVNSLITGYINPLQGSTQSVVATIKNSSIGTRTNVNVNLNVTGANTLATTQVIPTLAPGATTQITFSGLTFANSGAQDVTVSVDADEDNSNNTITRGQMVSCDTMGYATTDPMSTNIGYNTGSGILAIKLTSPVVPTKATGVSVYIAEGAGNSVKGVLLNAAGQIIDSSASVTLTAGQMDTYVNFPFLGNQNLAASAAFYIGIRQTANATTGYFPVGTQDPADIPAGRVYGFTANGGAETEYTFLGTLMVKAIVAGSFETTKTPASGQICSGSSATLIATPGFSNYNFFVNGASVQNGTATALAVTPASSMQFYVIGDYNSCSFTSLADSIKVVSVIQNAVTENICAGGSYIFNNATITNPGTYTGTFLSAGGCDSTVTLTLTMTTVDKTTTVAGKIITATQAGATYQWINCANNAAIAGKTSQSFTADSTGSYAVIVTLNGCSDTSACVAISFADVTEIQDLYNVNLYPNPTSDNVNITSSVLLNDIQVTDLNGKVILSQKVNGMSTTVNLTNLETGIYMVILNSEKGSVTKQVVRK